LMQSSSTCRRTQAQHLVLATRLASQLKLSSNRMAPKSSGLVVGSAPDDDRRQRRVGIPRLRPSSRRRNRLTTKQGSKRACVGLDCGFRKGHQGLRVHRGL
jgi:hypothetical protein